MMLFSRVMQVGLPLSVVILISGCGGAKNGLLEPPLETPLNDTGATYCVDIEGSVSGCTAAPWQDGNNGRDYTAAQGLLDKVGGGAGGLDFTKLDQNGEPLADQTRPWADNGSETEFNQWSCVHDNVTGLTWEVKSPVASSLRHPDYTYQWHSIDDLTNGGERGMPGDEPCGSVLCNTQAYTDAMNQQKLCGFDDWRLPTVNQMLSLVVTDYLDLVIDRDFFPHTQPSHYWTSQSYAPQRTHAWYMYFSDGSPSSTLKSKPMFVRLVRSSLRPVTEAEQ